MADSGGFGVSLGQAEALSGRSPHTPAAVKLWASSRELPADVLKIYVLRCIGQGIFVLFGEDGMSDAPVDGKLRVVLGDAAVAFRRIVIVHFIL